ncbi:hypothetical protein PR048_028471 [Dryococelus australis]|uniref:Uncharacterized protein n=1 Tax=Dryococelus australis TaxID=614101 RepID=A0ABQ9GAN1_9NEOP|nr:hypothetical protein PR048_028471 [Dryococelus australis]
MVSEKVKKAKTFMTRLIKEVYGVLKKDNNYKNGSSKNEDCWLKECDDCPGTEILTVESLGLVTFAIWEHGDLIRKSVSIDNFLKNVRHWVKKAIPHSYIRKIQSEGIAKAKVSVQQTNVFVR